MIDGKQGVERNKNEGRLGVVTERGKELHDSAHRSSPPKASQFPYIRVGDSILFFMFVYIGELATIGVLLMRIKYISLYMLYMV